MKGHYFPCGDAMRTVLKVLLFFVFATIGVSCKKKIKIDPRLSDFSSLNLKALDTPGTGGLPDLYYDPDLYAFVSEYIQDAKTHGIEVAERTIQALRIIRWVDKLSVGEGPGVMAACSRYYVTETALLFNTDTVLWTMIEALRSETQAYTQGNRLLLRELMYHELTHCLLEKGHLPDGVDGIMSPVFTEGNTEALFDWTQLVNDNFSAYFLKLEPDIGT